MGSQSSKGEVAAEANAAAADAAAVKTNGQVATHSLLLCAFSFFSHRETFVTEERS